MEAQQKISSYKRVLHFIQKNTNPMTSGFSPEGLAVLFSASQRKLLIPDNSH